MGDRTDYFANGNIFAYYSRSHFFVALDVNANREWQGWVVCEEEGRDPDVIVALLSPSTAAIDNLSKNDSNMKH